MAECTQPKALKPSGATCGFMYEGQESCDDILEHLQTVGFTGTLAKDNSGRPVCEGDSWFHPKGARMKFPRTQCVFNQRCPV